MHIQEKWKHHIHTKTCTLMFTAASIAKRWKRPRCPSRGEWGIRCGPAVRKKKGWSTDSCYPWMDLESTRVNERSHYKYQHTLWFQLHEKIQNRQIHRQKVDQDCQGLMVGGRRGSANRPRVSFWGNENLLKLDSSNICVTV